MKKVDEKKKQKVMNDENEDMHVTGTCETLHASITLEGDRVKELMWWAYGMEILGLHC